MSEKFNNKYRIASARWKDWDYGWAASYFATICTKNRENYFGEIVNGKMKLSPAGILADVLWHEIKNHAKNIELGEYVIMPNHVHGIVTLYGDDAPVKTAPPVETGPALSNPSAEGFGDSSAEGSGDSSAEGSGDSSPEGSGDSSAEGSGDSSPEAFGDSSPEAFGDSSPEAFGDSSPEGFGDSSSEAFKDPSIEGFPNADNIINESAGADDKTGSAGADESAAADETRQALSLREQNPAQQRFQNQGKNTLSSIIGSYKSAVTRHANRLQIPMGWQPRFHDHVIRDEKEFYFISNYISNNVDSWEKDKFHKS